MKMRRMKLNKRNSIAMPLRDKHDYVESGVLDYPKKELCRHVWKNHYLLPTVRKEILRKYYYPLEEQGLSPREWTERILLCGGICTHQYNEKSDIDLTIIINTDKLVKIDNIKKDYLHALVSTKLNVTNLDGTEHPMNYFVRDDYKVRGEGIFDVIDDRWIKRPPRVPEDYEPTDIFKNVWDDMQDWLGSVDSIIGEAERDIFDYELILSRIKELNGKNKAKFLKDLENKLKEIDGNLENLLSKYEELEYGRKLLMEDRDFQEPRLYEWSKNWAPENIKWKIAERYNYLKIMKTIKNIIDDGLQHDEIKDVKKILESNKISSIIQFISLKILKKQYGG